MRLDRSNNQSSQSPLGKSELESEPQSLMTPARRARRDAEYNLLREKVRHAVNPVSNAAAHDSTAEFTVDDAARFRELGNLVIDQLNKSS